MILNDKMLSAAFNLRKAEPWYFLTDSDIFAVSLSTGETGYCCVMGNGGEHYALGLYIGDKGFSSYLKSLSMGQMGQIEIMETAMTFDCINCDFMNAADMSKKTKKVIRDYAESHDTKIPRPNGWPDFTRHSPYKEQHCITNERDAKAITEALEATLYIVEGIDGDFYKMWFGEDMGYPTNKGGKSVPLLIPQGDGAYKIGRTELPALQKDVYPTPIFNNDILAHQVKGIQKSNDFLCRLIHLPVSLNSDADEVPSLPAILMGIDSETGFAIQVPVVDGAMENSETVLLDFAKEICSSSRCPQRILVSDEFTYNLLDDFCHKCGITIEKKKSIPAIDEALQFLFQQMMM